MGLKTRISITLEDETDNMNIEISHDSGEYEPIIAMSMLAHALDGLIDESTSSEQAEIEVRTKISELIGGKK